MSKNKNTVKFICLAGVMAAMYVGLDFLAVSVSAPFGGNLKNITKWIAGNYRFHFRRSSMGCRHRICWGFYRSDDYIRYERNHIVVGSSCRDTWPVYGLFIQSI